MNERRIIVKMKRIVILLLTVLLISSCSHDTDGGEGTSETITSSSDTTTDNDQTSSGTDGDGTTGDLGLPPPLPAIEELVTPDPNRFPLASSDVLSTIVKGTSLDDLITTAGMPQRIGKMKVRVSISETTSVAFDQELPCLSYDTSEGTTYIFTVRTYTYEGAQNWIREVYSVRVSDAESTDQP